MHSHSLLTTMRRPAGHVLAALLLAWLIFPVAHVLEHAAAHVAHADHGPVAHTDPADDATPAHSCDLCALLSSHKPHAGQTATSVEGISRAPVCLVSLLPVADVVLTVLSPSAAPRAPPVIG